MASKGVRLDTGVFSPSLNPRTKRKWSLTFLRSALIALKCFGFSLLSLIYLQQVCGVREEAALL